jgi:hypothetical protein
MNSRTIINKTLILSVFVIAGYLLAAVSIMVVYRYCLALWELLRGAVLYNNKMQTESISKKYLKAIDHQYLP